MCELKVIISIIIIRKDQYGSIWIDMDRFDAKLLTRVAAPKTELSPSQLA